MQDEPGSAALPTQLFDADAVQVKLQARLDRAAALFRLLDGPASNCVPLSPRDSAALAIQCAWRQLASYRRLDALMVEKYIAEDELREQQEQRRWLENDAFHETMLLNQKIDERKVFQRNEAMRKTAAAAVIQTVWRHRRGPSRIHRVLGSLGDQNSLLLVHGLDGALANLSNSELPVLERELDNALGARSEQLVNSLERRDGLKSQNAELEVKIELALKQMRISAASQADEQ